MNYFAAHNGTSEPTARWRNFGRPQQPTIGAWSSQGPRQQLSSGGGTQWTPQIASQIYHSYENTNDQGLRDAMIRDMQGTDNAQGFNNAMRAGGYMLNGGPGGQYSYTGGHQATLPPQGPPTNSKGPQPGPGGYQAYRDRVMQTGDNLLARIQGARAQMPSNTFAATNATRGMGGGMNAGQPTFGGGDLRMGGRLSDRV